MRAYNIDFKDGSRLCVDANDEIAARTFALQTAYDNGHEEGDDGATIEAVTDITSPASPGTQKRLVALGDAATDFMRKHGAL